MLIILLDSFNSVFKAVFCYFKQKNLEFYYLTLTYNQHNTFNIYLHISYFALKLVNYFTIIYSHMATKRPNKNVPTI